MLRGGMSMRSFSLKSLGHLAVVMTTMQVGCSSAIDDGPGTAGQSSGTAGKTSTGGATGTAGTNTTTAGTNSTGGNGTAGATNTAGSTGTAGTSPTAGSPPVGTAGSGGTANTGGSGTGGSPPTNTGGANWGKEEDPGAHCTLSGPMPDYAALTADGKLPDPFKKLDGTRIKDKSEWACRREEILKQLAKYIYGEKPIPKKGSVTGTVTATKISVKVDEDGHTASFDVTVNMNGATAPAPALISYGAG